MKNNEILFAAENETVIIPSKRVEDGAFDIYANFEDDYMVIQPHATAMIPTGLRSAFSSDYVAILKERGSTGSKGIGQRCGVIDSGFRGVWQVPLTNHDHNKPIVIIKKGKDVIEGENYLTDWSGHSKKVTSFYDEKWKDRFILYPYEKAICQCIMVEVPKLEIKQVSKEEIMNIESERGEGMLGSSKK